MPEEHNSLQLCSSKIIPLTCECTNYCCGGHQMQCRAALGCHGVHRRGLAATWRAMQKQALGPAYSQLRCLCCIARRPDEGLQEA